MRIMHVLAVLMTAVAAIACIAMPHPAAAAVNLSDQVSFDIPSQPLPNALLQFSTQSGVEFTVATEAIEGRQAAAVRGTYSMEQALALLLSNTGLEFEPVDNGTVAIRTARNKVSLTSEERVANKDLAVLKLTRARDNQTATVQGVATTPVSANARDSDAQEKSDQRTPEILVRGEKFGFSLNTDIRRSRDDIQPYMIVEREDLEKSGYRNVEDFLRNRITASGSYVGSSQLPGLSSASSAFSLRGLDIGETLILVDGHRKGGWSFAGAPQQADVNGIPMAAIERIEILPTTASGIYGGDATGGVINIVLRRDYSGLETKLQYESPFEAGAPQRQVEMSSGFNFSEGRTNLLFAASYSDTDPIFVGERDFSDRGRAAFLRNNPAAIFSPFANPVLGHTTNIRSADGSPLTLKNGGGPVGSPYTFVPEGYTGVASDNGQGFIDNADQYNFALADTSQWEGGANYALINKATRKAVMATLRHEFTPTVAAYLDTAATLTKTSSFSSGSFGSSFTVDGAAAHNPFDQTVVVTTPLLGADSSAPTELRGMRAIAGVLLGLPREWRASLSYTFDRNRYENKSLGSIDTFNPFAPAPLAVADGTIDVFRDTNISGVDFSPYVQPGSSIMPSDKTLQDATLLINGPLWSLPAGKMTLSTSFGHRRDHQSENVQGGSLGPGLDYTFTNYPRTQTVDSIYMETIVPLVSEANAMPGVRLLELQVAGRWDSYESIGTNSSFSLNLEPRVDFTNEVSSVNPTLGLRYQFVPDVTLRASYNTGFLAPTVAQLDEARTVTDLSAFETIVDPRRGNEVVHIVTLISGNSDLDPEKSEGWNVGMIFTPRFAPGLRVSVDWIWLEKMDNIDILPFFLNQDIINAELIIPGVITREDAAPGDPFGVGPISELNVGVRNLARRRVEAYDIAADYRFETARYGAFTFAAAATRSTHDITESVPGLPLLEQVDTGAGNLRWKGNSTLTWDWRNVTLAWTSSYYHSYAIYPFSAANYGSQTRIPSQLYHDLFASYRFERPDSSLLSKTEIQLGIKNVFDKDPPLTLDSFSFGTFYQQWADPRLASYSIALKKGF